MKKMLLGALLAAAVAFANTGAGITDDAPKPADAPRAPAKKHRKSTVKTKHKSKKSSGDTSTPPPK
ncbi:MAG: hypothetical protein M3O35_17370 [Acidobacteriota bacterium]|nr:hypothetical protein [Acidobacteriota bacterium]